MRRLPPNKVEQNLNGLLNLIPEETDELLQRIDQPLKEETDSETVTSIILICILKIHRDYLFLIIYLLFREENIYYVIIIVMEIHTGMNNCTLYNKNLSIYSYTLPSA